jgi:hypothetical protein
VGYLSDVVLKKRKIGFGIWLHDIREGSRKRDWSGYYRNREYFYY